jgi:SH3-like domain-containing protein
MEPMQWVIMCCTVVITTYLTDEEEGRGKTLRVTISTLILLVALACLAPVKSPLHVANSKAASGNGLPVPRFISISKQNANLRVGPGKRYPVSWIYRRRDVPVLVTAEFEHWRKVLDADGAVGWLHKTLLSGKRTAVVIGEPATFHLIGDNNAPIIYRAEAGVIGELETCVGGWCRMKVRDRSGWIERHLIFGALPNEEFD